MRPRCKSGWKEMDATDGSNKILQSVQTVYKKSFENMNHDSVPTVIYRAMQKASCSFTKMRKRAKSKFNFKAKLHRISLFQTFIHHEICNSKILLEWLVKVK